jgi:Amidohydrolase family
MRSLLGILLIASTLAAQVILTGTPDTLVLTHVNVIDTRHGLTLPDMTVVIKNARIQAVAKLGLISASHHTHVINATGKYLIPGLWDMHVHSTGLGKPWDPRVILPLYVANGITGIRDMGGDPNLLVARRRQIEAGELLGPHMVIAGPFLNGGKTDSETIGVNTPEEARQAVDSLKAKGMDFIKILSNLTPAVYWAIADEAKIQHLRFVGHIPPAISPAEAAEMGQASVEHLTGVLLAASSKEEELRPRMLDAIDKKDGETYAALESQALDTYSPPKAWELFGKFVDNCAWQVPTLVWDVADASAGNPAAMNDPHLKYVPASVVKDWQPSHLDDAAQKQLALARRITEKYMDIVRTMRHAGVLFLAGSDSPDPYDIPGFSLHDELDLLVKAGFSTTEALQSATFNPALFLAKLDRYGVVEDGHAADLVLLEANPLREIGNTRKISAVIVAGKYFGRAELDKMLERAEAIAKTQ